MIFCRLQLFFKMNFFKKFFQEQYPSVKKFRSSPFGSVMPVPEVIKHFPCSTQLSMKFILLINVKKPTVVGILTFFSMINTTSKRLTARNFFICQYFFLVFSSS